MIHTPSLALKFAFRSLFCIAALLSAHTARAQSADPQDAAVRARWGDLAAAAGKTWLMAVPGDVANVWREVRWIVPGAQLAYHRGFCVAAKCQGTEYQVRYNEAAGQLEFSEGSTVSYVGRVQADGSVRITGTTLLGALTPETLRWDGARNVLVVDQHELTPSTGAQLVQATRGYAGQATANAEAAAKPASAPPSASEAELRAELAAMQAKVNQLQKQVEAQREPALTPREAKARAAEEQRIARETAAREKAQQAADARAKAREEAQAKAAEAQAKAAEAKRAAEEKRAAAEAEKARIAEEKVAARARAREEAEMKVAEAKRAAEDKRVAAEAEKARSAPEKFGALAVDRDNGFYYGWATDQESIAAAEQRAEQECRKRGGNCSVVVLFAGAGCAAYRTVQSNVGTAYGWGVAATRPDADARATSEALKRSNGRPVPNNVWGCNAKNAGAYREIRNEPGPAASPRLYKDAEGDEFAYEGEMRDGMPNGKGTATYPKKPGKSYVGSFANGLPDGSGVARWPNGDVYEGEFRKGHQQGHGVYRWPSGAWYDGEWDHGDMHGRGKYRFRTGRVFEGMMNRNKPVE